MMLCHTRVQADCINGLVLISLHWLQILVTPYWQFWIL